jgi:hypothetical protein
MLEVELDSLSSPLLVQQEQNDAETNKPKH